MAGEVRKGVVSRVAEGPAVSHPGVLGPVGQPHQFKVASTVSPPVYVAPALLPEMLLWFAILVEMVPAN